MNHSSINYIINSSSSNYFVKNYNSPMITVNNKRKSDILNKKINYLYNENINFNNYANNKTVYLMGCKMANLDLMVYTVIAIQKNILKKIIKRKIII